MGPIGPSEQGMGTMTRTSAAIWLAQTIAAQHAAERAERAERKADAAAWLASDAALRADVASWVARTRANAS